MKKYVISEDTVEAIRKWKEDSDAMGADGLLYTDGDMCDKAIDIFDTILNDAKELTSLVSYRKT